MTTSYDIDVREVPFRKTQRAPAHGAHLPARIFPRARGPSRRPRPPRRRLEQQGPKRERADGARRRGERRARGVDRHDARARGAVSGERAGRALRRALAQAQGARVERRPVHARHPRQLDRRPHGRADRAQAPRSEVRGAPAHRSAERRREHPLSRVALADQRPGCALRAGRQDEARPHDPEQQELLGAVGDDQGRQPAVHPRAQGARRAAAASSCRARSTTTCCPRSRKSSSPPGVPPAARRAWRCSKAASTSGSRSRDRRPTARTRWCASSSPASSTTRASLPDPELRCFTDAC